MRVVYVNGEAHKTIVDALLTTGGQYVGLKKALNCGLTYHGFRVSYDPDPPGFKWKVPDRLKGSALIRHPKVTP